MSAHRTSRYSMLAVPLALDLLLIAGAVSIATQRADPEVLAGQASVIDGDTIRVAGRKERLQAID